MSAARALLTGSGYTPEHLSQLTDCGLEVIHRLEIEPGEFDDLLPTLDAHVLGGSERLDADRLGRASRLRVVSFVGKGVGAFVDEAAAAACGIAVLNTPGVMTRAVAEHTVGMLLSMYRGLFAQNEAVKRGLPLTATSTELGSASVGIVGMGEIGSEVARTLFLAFGCSMSYHSRSRKPELEHDLGLRYVDMATLFETSDAIVLLLPTSADTRGIVGSALLERAKPGLVLINTAGADLVDPDALRCALQDGRVGAAGFDGYWTEPPPPAAADTFGLLGLADHQFVITPHSAASTPETWNRMVSLAVDNAVQAFAGSESGR